MPGKKPRPKKPPSGEQEETPVDFYEDLTDEQIDKLIKEPPAAGSLKPFKPFIPPRPCERDNDKDVPF